jgi:hypothetical protein
MKRGRFTEEQVIALLREHEPNLARKYGRPVAHTAPRGVSTATTLITTWMIVQ